MKVTNQDQCQEQIQAEEEGEHSYAENVDSQEEDTHALLHKMIKCYWSYKEKPDNHLFLITGTLHCAEINDLNIHEYTSLLLFSFLEKREAKI